MPSTFGIELVLCPLPEPGSEALLAKVLEKKKASAPSAQVKPDWDQVHRELQRHKGVTLLLLLDEYQETVQARGYSYSRLCKHYAAYAKRLKPSYRNTYTPGDRLFIDYAGSSVPIRDPRTGEAAQDAQIFVAVLGVFELRLCRSNVESGVVLLDRFPCPLLRVPGRQSRPPGPGHPQKRHHHPRSLRAPRQRDLPGNGGALLRGDPSGTRQTAKR